MFIGAGLVEIGVWFEEFLHSGFEVLDEARNHPNYSRWVRRHQLSPLKLADPFKPKQANLRNTDRNRAAGISEHARYDRMVRRMMG